MTTKTHLLGSTAALVVAALALVAGTASAAPPPTITAGQGCSVQCISKALVSVTATSAKVELATTVPAHLRVTVSEAPSGNGGGLAASTVRTVSISAFSPSRTAYFANLEPDTTYTIVVRATDLKGRSSKRSGTFKTLPFKTTGLGGSSTLDSGAGCSAQCITRALVSQKQPAGNVARFDIRTSTRARIQIDVSRDKPVQTAAGLAQYDVVARKATNGLTKAWAPEVGGLDYGTRYYVVVRAQDAQGRVSYRQGSFRTVSATATVTLYYIKVVEDGDKVGKGELFFRLWLGDDVLPSWGTGLRKLNSGDLTTVNPAGSTRPGFSFQVPANGDAKFRMNMLGEECDNVLKKNCLLEAWGPSNLQWGSAGGTFDVSSLLQQGALPGWYGTGVTPPAGHDGHFVFSTTDRPVKFHVLGTIDLDVDWP